MPPASHPVITPIPRHEPPDARADVRRRRKPGPRRQRTDVGKIDSLRATVLHLVVTEQYASAKNTLEGYIETKTAYPEFQERASRYNRHCGNLIDAIETKRNFPGYASLTLAKQQELHERVISHFEELKQGLKHIESIERDVKIVDLRSTVWVLRSLVLSTAAVYCAAFILDLRAGFLSSFVTTT
jgi:hypothetical protein